MTMQKEAGQPIDEVNFHDGNLLGMFIGDDDQISLFIETIHSGKYTLLLGGVVRLRATEFLEGNITLDLTVRSGKELSAKLLDELNLVSMHSENMTKLLHKYKTEEFRIIEMNPSYGCSLLALCSSAKLAKGVILNEQEQPDAWQDFRAP